MPLTDEQKKIYRKKGEIFKADADRINEELIRLEISKSKLEKIANNIIPKTPNGIGFCNLCYVQSMVPSGYRNHFGTKNKDVSQPIYECEICGYVEIKHLLPI